MTLQLKDQGNKQEDPAAFRNTKDLLCLDEFTPDEFTSILDLAESFKKEKMARSFERQIPGTSLALLFEKPSTRTRVSFEVAMFELGGHAVVLNSRDMQLSRGETPEDTAKTLSLYCDAICARVYSHDTLIAFSEAVDVPVINALSDLYHPCQTIADIQAIGEAKGFLRGAKIAWIGDGNNVCNSLLIGAALSGMNMAVACPPGYDPLPAALASAKSISSETGSEIMVTKNPETAIRNADVVVTDTFVSMGDEGRRQERLETFLPKYQVSAKLFSLAGPEAVFMHCLPAHRGEEVSNEVIDGPKSIIWLEAANRLHAQKAVLYYLLQKFAI